MAWFRRLASRRAGQSGDLPRATRSSSTELAGSGAAGRGALLAGSAELLLGGGAGGFTEMAAGAADTGAVWRGCDFGESGGGAFKKQQLRMELSRWVGKLQ